MHNPVVVKILETSQSLHHVRLDVGRRECDLVVFDDDFHVRVDKLKHQRDIRFVPKHIQQCDDILMVQFLQQFYFPQCSSVDAITSFLATAQLDLLHRDNVVILNVSRFIYQRKLKLWKFHEFMMRLGNSAMLLNLSLSQKGYFLVFLVWARHSFTISGLNSCRLYEHDQTTGRKQKNRFKNSKFTNRNVCSST